jgi:hypothetical protein
MSAYRLFVGILTCIICFFWLSWAAKAVPDRCWERGTFSIRLDTLGASNPRRLKGDELAAAVRWWNTQEPVSEGEWQTFILADLPDGGGFILIGREDQACIRLQVPASEWLKVKLQMLGLPV